MSAFTRLGTALWDWEPFTELCVAARVLWLALYTSAEAKRHVPGLWQGGIPSMADAARMAPDEVRIALDQLLEREIVEYDPKFRVLRLCELPDAGEYPNNGKVILGWWTKFNTVPQCAVRDAHVRTIGWIMETGSQRLHGVSATATPNHQAAWASTFGTIQIPSLRRRGLRRLADSDTGTQAQPSLFPLLSPNALSVPSESQSGISSAPGYPQVPLASVDNSAVLRQSNKITVPEMVSDTVSDTVSHTNRIPDPGSRIPDLSSLSGERGLGGGHETGMRPSLSLVPPYTANQVLAILGQGNWDQELDKAYQDALGAMIPRWSAAGVTADDFRVLAQYNTHSGRRWNARLLVGSDLHSEISTAHRVISWRDVQVVASRSSGDGA